MRLKLRGIRNLELQILITSIIAVGAVAAIILHIEIFPFSRFSMYSELFLPAPDYRYFRVFALTDKGGEQPLKLERNLTPFRDSTFRMALLSDMRPEALRTKLAATLKWYNTNVFDPDVHINGLKLYRYSVPWVTLTALADNGNFPEFSEIPGARRTVVVEVEP